MHFSNVYVTLVCTSLIYGVFTISVKELSNKDNVKISSLEKDARTKPLTVLQSKSRPSVLYIFCYSGETEKRLTKIFTSATFRLSILADGYQLYKGRNETDVFEQYEMARQRWFSFMPWRTESIDLPIFNKSCVGVVSEQEYNVKLDIKSIDVWIVSYLIIGLFLFFFAERLSRNVLFFYGTGVSLGLVASLLIVVFILSRFMPKKHYGAYAVLAGGWSVAIFLLQKVWENVEEYLEKYLHYVIGYFVVAGVLSFAYCYYKGPPTEPRSLNLIKWGIQLLAVFLIYNGSQIPSISITTIGVVILYYNFPVAITRAAKSFWRRRFPPKIKLLTEEEYHKQANEETQKALQELKEYCRSPNCDAWKTISRLGSPHKFANWIDGDSHISEDEFKAYESVNYSDSSNHMPSYLETDDEEEIEFRLNSL